MAANTDLLKKLSRRWVGQIGAGGVADASTTTIPLASSTNLATDTAVVATIDRVDSSGTATPALEETIIGVVSGSNLTSSTRGVEGTAQAHSAGAVVEILVTAKGWNDLVDHLLLQHNQLGYHTNITACNITASGTSTLSTIASTGTSTLSHITASSVTALRFTGTGIKDEDDMASDSATHLATQQSIKAYVDSIGGAGGWTTYSAVVPTRTTDNDPEFVITFAAVDLTSTLYAGMKIKWTQNSTVRYGIITKTAFSTNTTVTVYGGTDYNVENTGTYVISAFNYSRDKAPNGFPLSPAKWTVTTTSTANDTQATPTNTTWYNLGTLTIDIPTGIWDVSYQVIQLSAHASNTDINIFTTLSDANNSESDIALTSISSLKAATGSLQMINHVYRNAIKDLSAEDTFYLNAKTTVSSTTISHRGDLGTTVIKAVSMYL